MNRSRTPGWLYRHVTLSGMLLSSIAVGAPAHAAPSLPYTVRAWTVEDGLPTSTVQDIAQTPDGYLWLSTTGGLARFDGMRFETFGLAQGLPSNRFQGLCVDRDGTLWISSEDGSLIRRDGRGFTYQPTGTLFAAQGLLPLADGSILGAARDEYWLRSGTRISHFASSSQDSVTSAVVDVHGDVWLTIRGGAPARFAGGRIVAMAPAGHWTDHWILDRRSGAARFVRRSGADAELLDTRLQRVVVLEDAAFEVVQWIDRQGQLWSLAGDGVTARHADTGRLIGTLSLGLTAPKNVLFLDRQDNVWVGSWSQGLYRLSRSPLTLLRPPGEEAPVSILSALEDRAGRVIVFDNLNRLWNGYMEVIHGAPTPQTWQPRPLSYEQEDNPY